MHEIIKKINQKLKPSGWYDQLRIYLESDFSDIILELKNKVEQDKQRFCPALNTAFRFMEEVPYDKVKTVMLIDYTCNRLQQADGIPMSSAELPRVDQTPLRLFRSIDDQSTHDPNDWAKQGVLIVPLSLTSRIEGKPHKKLWEPFIMRIIESVNRKHKAVPWLLINEDTWKYEEDIVSPNIRRTVMNSPMNDKQWPAWINETLKGQKKPPITW